MAIVACRFGPLSAVVHTSLEPSSHIDFLYDKGQCYIAELTLTIHTLGTSQDVVNFRQLMTGGKAASGLPKFDPNRGVRVRRMTRLGMQASVTDSSAAQVHGSQSIEILKPLPAVSGDGWKLKKRIVAVSENSTRFLLLPRAYSLYLRISHTESGIIVENEVLLVDAQGTPYAKLHVRFSPCPSYPLLSADAAHPERILQPRREGDGLKFLEAHRERAASNAPA